MPTVLLFDVDGTLVTTPGVGRRALERIFVARFGRSGSSGTLRGIRFDGMTDRAIVRAALAGIGAPSDEGTIDALLADYLPQLAAEIAETPGYGLHRGVRTALDAAAARPRTALGLGTGNIREGARMKLEHVGIFDRFAFGGFGCDHEERSALLRIGAARGAALLGVPLAACRVVVIGDTPRDVAAADAIGAESIGVGTCGYTRAQLAGSGATWAFDDLAAPGVHAALLDGTR